MTARKIQALHYVHIVGYTYFLDLVGFGDFGNSDSYCLA